MIYEPSLLRDAVVILAVLFAGIYIGAQFATAKSRAKRVPTPMQRALSSQFSNEIRVARMHGFFDGWALAHRTDSKS